MFLSFHNRSPRIRPSAASVPYTSTSPNMAMPWNSPFSSSSSSDGTFFPTSSPNWHSTWNWYPDNRRAAYCMMIGAFICISLIAGMSIHHSSSPSFGEIIPAAPVILSAHSRSMNIGVNYTALAIHTAAAMQEAMMPKLQTLLDSHKEASSAEYNILLQTALEKLLQEMPKQHAAEIAATAVTAQHAAQRIPAPYQGPRKCLENVRCVDGSKLIAGMGTFHRAHDRARAARDTWLRCLPRQQWLIASDVLDWDVPTVQLDLLGIRHRFAGESKARSDESAVAHGDTQKLFEEYNNVHKAVYLGHDAPKTSFLGRVDGDRRFLALPLMLNLTLAPMQYAPKTSARGGYLFPPIADQAAAENWEWLLIADDDTYFDISKLLSVLVHFDPKQPYILGKYLHWWGLQIPYECHCDVWWDENEPTMRPCWTLEARQRAALEKAKQTDPVNWAASVNLTDTASLPRTGLPTFSPSTRSTSCPQAHAYGGVGIILSRGLMNMLPASHWRWCMQELDKTALSGDVMIARCIYEAGIGVINIEPYEASEKTAHRKPSSVPFWSEHFSTGYHDRSFQDRWEKDPAKPLCENLVH